MSGPDTNTLARADDLFDVFLMSVGSGARAVANIVRNYRVTSLQDAQKFLERLPAAVRTGLIEKDAQLLRQRLARAGAGVEVHSSPPGTRRSSPGPSTADVRAATQRREAAKKRAAAVVLPSAGPTEVVLTDAGPRKIAVIKAVQRATRLGLQDANDLVDQAPSILGRFPTAAAAGLRQAIMAAGGSAKARSDGLTADVASAARPRRATTRAMRRAFSKREKKQVLVECGSAFHLQYDHIVPVALRGAHTAAHLQVLCSLCNQRKGTAVG